MLSINELKEILEYYPISGILLWKKKVAAKVIVGKEAGCTSKGYRIVRIKGRRYYSHIIAYAIYYNKWPETLIDHADRNSLNNSILNLRPTNRSQNAANSDLSLRNSTGLKGVYWHKRIKTWWSAITVNKKQIYLGKFDTPEEAQEAYNTAARRYFGEFASPAGSVITPPQTESKTNIMD